MSEKPLSQMSLRELLAPADSDKPFYEALSRALRSEIILSELQLMLITSQDDYERSRLAQLLGKVGEPSSIPYLVEALNFDEFTSLTALASLQEIGTPEALELAQAYKQKQAGKPQKWRALRELRESLRAHWKAEQELSDKAIEGWIEDALGNDEEHIIYETPKARKRVTREFEAGEELEASIWALGGDEAGEQRDVIGLAGFSVTRWAFFMAGENPDEEDSDE